MSSDMNSLTAADQSKRLNEIEVSFTEAEAAELLGKINTDGPEKLEHLLSVKTKDNDDIVLKNEAGRPINWKTLKFNTYFNYQATLDDLTDGKLTKLMNAVTFSAEATDYAVTTSENEKLKFSVTFKVSNIIASDDDEYLANPVQLPLEPNEKISIELELQDKKLASISKKIVSISEVESKQKEKQVEVEFTNTLLQLLFLNTEIRRLQNELDNHKDKKNAEQLNLEILEKRINYLDLKITAAPKIKGSSQEEIKVYENKRLQLIKEKQEVAKKYYDKKIELFINKLNGGFGENEPKKPWIDEVSSMMKLNPQYKSLNDMHLLAKDIFNHVKNKKSISLKDIIAGIATLKDSCDPGDGSKLIMLLSEFEDYFDDKHEINSKNLDEYTKNIHAQTLRGNPVEKINGFLAYLKAEKIFAGENKEGREKKIQDIIKSIVSLNSKNVDETSEYQKLLKDELAKDHSNSNYCNFEEARNRYPDFIHDDHKIIYEPQNEGYKLRKRDGTTSELIKFNTPEAATSYRERVYNKVEASLKELEIADQEKISEVYALYRAFAIQDGFAIPYQSKLVTDHKVMFLQKILEEVSLVDKSMAKDFNIMRFPSCYNSCDTSLTLDVDKENKQLLFNVRHKSKAIDTSYTFALSLDKNQMKLHSVESSWKDVEVIKRLSSLYDAYSDLKAAKKDGYSLKQKKYAKTVNDFSTFLKNVSDDQYFEFAQYGLEKSHFESLLADHENSLYYESKNYVSFAKVWENLFSDFWGKKKKELDPAKLSSILHYVTNGSLKNDEEALKALEMGLKQLLPEVKKQIISRPESCKTKRSKKVLELFDEAQKHLIDKNLHASHERNRKVLCFNYIQFMLDRGSVDENYVPGYPAVKTAQKFYSFLIGTENKNKSLSADQNLVGLKSELINFIRDEEFNRAGNSDERQKRFKQYVEKSEKFVSAFAGKLPSEDAKKEFFAHANCHLHSLMPDFSGVPTAQSREFLILSVQKEVADLILKKNELRQSLRGEKQLQGEARKNVLFELDETKKKIEKSVLSLDFYLNTKAGPELDLAQINKVIYDIAKEDVDGSYISQIVANEKRIHSEELSPEQKNHLIKQNKLLEKQYIASKQPGFWSSLLYGDKGSLRRWLWSKFFSNETLKKEYEREKNLIKAELQFNEPSNEGQSSTENIEALLNRTPVEGHSTLDKNEELVSSLQVFLNDSKAIDAASVADVEDRLKLAVKISHAKSVPSQTIGPIITKLQVLMDKKSSKENDVNQINFQGLIVDLSPEDKKELDTGLPSDRGSLGIKVNQ